MAYRHSFRQKYKHTTTRAKQMEASDHLKSWSIDTRSAQYWIKSSIINKSVCLILIHRNSCMKEEIIIIMFEIKWSVVGWYPATAHIISSKQMLHRIFCHSWVFFRSRFVTPWSRWYPFVHKNKYKTYTNSTTISHNRMRSQFD